MKTSSLYMIHKIYRKAVIGQTIGFCIASALSLVIVWLLGSLLNDIQEHKGKYIVLLVLFLCASALQLIAEYFFSVWADKQRYKSTQKMREVIYANYLNSPTKIGEDAEPGQLLTVLEKDVNQISAYYTNELPKLILSVLGIVGYGIYFFCMLHWLPLLCISLIGLLQMIPPYIMQRYLVKNYEKAGELEGALHQQVLSGILGFSTIKQLGLYEWFIGEYKRVQSSYRKVGVTAAGTAAIQTSMQNTTSYLQQIGLAVILGFLVINKWLAVDLAVQCFALSNNIYTYLGQLFSARSQTALRNIAIARLRQTISFENQITMDKDAIDSSQSGCLRLHHACYSVGNEVLYNDVCWEFCSKSVYLLRGINGVGKSTLLRLLCGEVAWKSGEMLWENECISAQNAAMLCSYCPQTPPTLEFTGKEIFSFLEETLDVEKWNLVQVKFGLSSDLLSQSLSALSGGQRKKLFLAIALARKSHILLLDEPESSLDNRTLHILREFLTNEERCVILVSHSHYFDDICSNQIEVLNTHLQLIATN